MAIRVRNINWRLLLLHLVGVPFLILGVQQLVLLWYVELIRVRVLYGENFFQHIPSTFYKHTAPQLIIELQMWEAIATLTAVSLACILLGIVVKQRRESRTLPLLLFVGSILLNYALFHTHSILSNLSLLLAGPFEQPKVYIRLIASGTLLIVAGILPFLITRRPFIIEYQSYR